MKYILLLLVCSVAMAADPGRLTVANFNKVEIGSNINYVRSCLGPETTMNYDYGGGDRSLLWKANGRTASVTFAKDKVRSKWQVGLAD